MNHLVETLCHVVKALLKLAYLFHTCD